MTKQYEFSINDLVAEQMRVHELNGTLRRWKVSTSVGAGIGGSAGTFAFSTVLNILHVWHPPVLWQVLLAALLSALGVYWKLHTASDSMRMRVLKDLRRRVGDAFPTLMETELNDAGLRVSWHGREFRVAWSHVTKVQQTASVMELILRPLAVVHIPLRALDQPGEIE